jgi:MFS family permease
MISWILSYASKHLAYPEVRGRRLLVGAVLLDILGVGLFNPISLLYFTLTTDVPLSIVGLAVSGATFITLPIGLIAAPSIDRWGSRAFLIIANLFYAAGFVVYLVADSAGSIFIGALLIGVSTRLYWSAWPPYVALVADGDGFHLWFAFLESLKSLAFAAAAILTAIALTSPTTTAAHALVVFNIFTSIAAAIAIWAISLPRKSADVEPGPTKVGPLAPAPWRSLLTNRNFWLLLLGQSLVAPTWEVGSLGFPIFFTQTWNLPVWYAVAIYAAGDLYIFGLQTALARRLANVRRTRVLVLGGGFMMSAMLLLLTVSTWQTTSWQPLIAVLVYGLVCTGFLIFQPAVYALAMSFGDSNSKSRVASSFDLSSATTIAIAPGVFGLLLTLNASWLWLAIGSAVSLGVLSLAAITTTDGARPER